jgi:hypothetical protein
MSAFRLTRPGRPNPSQAVPDWFEAVPSGRPTSPPFRGTGRTGWLWTCGALQAVPRRKRGEETITRHILDVLKEVPEASSREVPETGPVASGASQVVNGAGRRCVVPPVRCVRARRRSGGGRLVSHALPKPVRTRVRSRRCARSGQPHRGQPIAEALQFKQLRKDHPREQST